MLAHILRLSVKSRFIYFVNCGSYNELTISERCAMKLFKSITLVTFLLLAGGVQANDHVTAKDAWIREAPPGAQALAGYMQLHNPSEQSREVVGAASPAFDSVMLHKTVFEGEMSKMMHQRSINIPANGSVSFEPNGYHLMMMKPKHALRAGDKVTVTLSFKNGETLDVSHEVRATMGAHGMGRSEKEMHHHH